MRRAQGPGLNLGARRGRSTVSGGPVPMGGHRRAVLTALGGPECADRSAPSGLQSRLLSGGFFRCLSSFVQCKKMHRYISPCFPFSRLTEGKKKGCSTISSAMLLSPASVSHRNDPSGLHPGSRALLVPPLQDPGPCCSVVTACAPVHHTYASSKKAGSFAFFPARVHLLGRKFLCSVHQPAAL